MSFFFSTLYSFNGLHPVFVYNSIFFCLCQCLFLLFIHSMVLICVCLCFSVCAYVCFFFSSIQWFSLRHGGNSLRDAYSTRSLSEYCEQQKCIAIQCESKHIGSQGNAQLGGPVLACAVGIQLRLRLVSPVNELSVVKLNCKQMFHEHYKYSVYNTDI